MDRCVPDRLTDRLPWRFRGHRPRQLAGAIVVGLTLALTGCSSLLAPGQPSVWYQLEDRPGGRPTPAGEWAVERQPPSSDRSAITPAPNQTPPGPRPRLMLSALGAGALYESTGIVYGRSADQRAYYQFANWAERPSNRLVTLLDVRLNDRLRGQDPQQRDFAWVALDTSGLLGDWLLGLRIKEFFHDASAPHDRAIVEVDAELLDWQAKTLLARRRFRVEQPMSESSITAAVAGLSLATSQLLDQIGGWLASLAPPPRPAPTPPPRVISH